MNWNQTIDAYCERLGPEFWGEPLNAATNLAFMIAAMWMWPRVKQHREGRVLVGLLFLIGLGSFLFHTFATAWAAAADTLPIVGFAMFYIFLANRDFLGWPLGWSVLGALAYIPFTLVLIPLLEAVPFVQISRAYWPLPILIGGYAIFLTHRLPDVSKGLAIGALILTCSLVARSLDLVACDAIPLGTHFLWHVLNATMLAIMIEVWGRRATILRGV